MKYFISKYAPFYDPASLLGRPIRFRYLIDRQRVSSIEDPLFQQSAIIGGKDHLLVIYDDGVNTPIIGYVPTEHLEPYEEIFPPEDSSIISSQTPLASDGWQYITYAGKVQYNFCGQFCLSRVSRIPIVDLLEGWKAKDRKVWETFFNTKATARGTSDGELDRLAKKFDLPSQLLSVVMKFPQGKDVRYAPSVLRDLVGRGKVIASINVDPAYHFVKGSGVLHWVVVEKVLVDGVYGGWVHFWNSLSGRVELCTWREWLATTRNSPYGIFISQE